MQVRRSSVAVDEKQMFLQILKGDSWSLMAQSVVRRTRCVCDHEADVMVPYEAELPEKAATGGEVRVVAFCPTCKAKAVFYRAEVVGAELIDIMITRAANKSKGSAKLAGKNQPA